MRFGLLGPLDVRTDAGAPVPVPGRKVRALLAVLLVHEGRPVPADRVVDAIWGDRPPPSAVATLAAKVSQLRRALGDAEPGGRALVASGPAGYALRAAPEAVDARRFTALVARARSADRRAAAALLAEALGLWRGPVLADFADAEFARAFAAHLDEQRLAAQEDAADARLQLGEHPAVAAELGPLVAAHPLRERLRGCLIRALHGAGRQREALQSYHELRALLADELGLDPGPELVALHQAVLTRDPALDPPAPAGATLPAPRTELVGRAGAVAEVRTRLVADRLVTLTGPGGVGKTRLALAVATAAAAELPDGAVFVELAPVPGGAAAPVTALAEAVLTALEVRASPGACDPAGPLDRLAGALRARRLLLVLDNCEHVVDAAAELADGLLRAAPGVRVLATSREPLALAGEVVWVVPPLDVPDAGSADPEAVAGSSAARLFVARAAAAATGFRLDAATAAPVAVLCRRLDGIPLALELAATRVRALGVDGIVSRLDDRFRLLAAGHRGVPPRQRTLQAVIDWSWALLTPPEQTLLRRLAVHADGATAPDAAAVAADGGAGLPAVDVPDLLARLVDRSLLEVVPGPRPRYRLLESVAEYGRGKLRDAGETAAVRRRHAEHYAALGEAAAVGLHGPEQPAALRLLDAEAAELRAALTTATTCGDARLALRLVAALSWYWVLRGRLAEARRALDAALTQDGPAPAGLRATVRAWRAGTALLRGDADGRAEHAAAVRALATIDDPVVRARTGWFLAETGAVGDLSGVADLLDGVFAAAGSCGDRWAEAAALVTRARLAHVRGDAAAVERAAARAAALFADLGDRWGQMQANCWLGGHAELVADRPRAAALHEDGLRWAEELGLWPEVSTRLSWLGWLACQDGDEGRATAHAERALTLAVEQGVLDAQLFARIVLGYAARQGGRLDAADAHLHAALAATPPGTQDAPHVAMVLTELGFVAELRGDPAGALRRHAAAFDAAQDVAASRDLGLALEGLACALAAGGDHRRAATLLGAASAARAASGLPCSGRERADVERGTAAARRALGGAGFSAAFCAGTGLRPDQARAAAVSVTV